MAQLLYSHGNLDHFRQKICTFFHPMEEKLTAASVSTGQLDKQKQITIKVELKQVRRGF